MIALYTMHFERRNLTGTTLKSAVLVLALISLVSPGAGCSGKEEIAEEGIVAKVNGAAISRKELNRELLRIDKSFLVKTSHAVDQELEKEILRQVIHRRILLQEAQKKKIELKPEQARKVVADQKRGLLPEDLAMMLERAGITYGDWEKRILDDHIIEVLIQRVIDSKVQTSEEEWAVYYRDHPEEFQVEERIRVRQIVLTNQDEARKVRKRLTDGQEDFALVAAEVSLSPDAEKGGDLGTFPRGQMPKEFDNVCFSLQIGEISPVVKSPYGYHIFRVEERLPAGMLPFSEARKSIYSKLFSERREEAFLQYQKELWNRAEISILLEEE